MTGNHPQSVSQYSRFHINGGNGPSNSQALANLRASVESSDEIV
jgi:hypothetical protein